MKPAATPARCFAYLRVSTERQAGELQTSLTDQEAAIREMAAHLSVRVESWYRDAGASGASIEARPAFRQLIEDCEATPQPPRSPGIILVLNDSRFGRFPDPDEAAAIRFRLKRSGWHVRFCEGDDVQDVTFRSVIRSLGSAQASEYRRNIQRNARRGRKGAASQGFWTGREPIGYRRKVVSPAVSERVLEPGQHKAPNEKVKLTPHEEESAFVRWIFEQYASGSHSLGSLAREVQKRRPDRRWSRTVLQHLLCNPAYVGDVVGGRRVGDPALGDPEQYECRDAHPAIISRSLFESVRARLEENARRGPGRAATYLLSGLMMCPHCGMHYTGGGVGAKRMGSNRFYRDRGGIDGVCEGKIGTVMRHLIDPLVIREIGQIASRPKVRQQIERAIDQLLTRANGSSEIAAVALKRSLASAEKKRQRLVGAIASGLLEHAEAADQLAALRSDIERLTAELDAARFGSRRIALADENRERCIRTAMEFPSLADRLQGPALRNLVEPWLQSASFDKRSRVLTLGIYPAPGLQLYNSPGRVVQLKSSIRRIHVPTGRRVSA